MKKRKETTESSNCIEVSDLAIINTGHVFEI